MAVHMDRAGRIQGRATVHITATADRAIMVMAIMELIRTLVIRTVARQELEHPVTVHMAVRPVTVHTAARAAAAHMAAARI